MVMERKFFAYGVIDRDGQPYIKTGALSEDQKTLQIAVDYMNKVEAVGHKKDQAPFKVVQLVYFG
jgi:hypothetical protein